MCCSSPETDIEKKLKKVKEIKETEISKVKAFAEGAATNKYDVFHRTLTADVRLRQDHQIETVGKAMAKGKNWAMMAVATREDAVRLHWELSKKVWANLYMKELSLCYQLLGRHAQYWSGRTLDSVPPDKSSSLSSLCGQLVEIGQGPESRQVTMGAIVMKNDKLWAVTARHSEHRQKRRPALDDFDHKEYDKSILEPAWIIVPPPALPPRDTPRLQPKIRLQSVGDNLPSDPEWCLIPLNGHSDWYLQNQFKWRGVWKSLEEIMREPREGEVLVLAGASGPQTMEMLPTEASLCLPSGKWITTWQLKPRSTSST